MEHSYNMSVWLENYLLPVAIDPTRTDVRVPNPDEFRKIVRSYREDPCDRFVRNPITGEYVLKPTIDVGGGPGVMHRIIGTGQVKPCPAVYKKDRDQQQKRNRRTKGRKSDSHGNGGTTANETRSQHRTKWNTNNETYAYIQN